MLADWRTAPVDARLRAALALVEVLTLRPNEVGPEHVEPLRAAGVRQEGIDCVIHICAAFNVIVRVADAMGFRVQTDAQFAADAEQLLRRGYG